MAQSAFDEKLIARIAGGDRAAFAKVYEATKSSVYGFALSILRNRMDAEDVMHDTYLKLYQSAGTYRPQGRPMAFVLTIAKNLAYNKLRLKAWSQGAPGDGDLTRRASGGPGAAGEETFGRIEDRMILDTALEILDEAERQIVTLHAVSGFRFREIAELLNLNPSTVQSKYRRSLEKMKNELERKGVPL